MTRFAAALVFAISVATGARALAQVPPDAVWIDVRTPAEYAQGHLPQARLIPFDGIASGIGGLHLSKDAPIYLYCAAGGRAEKARQTLLGLGYTDVTNAGGLAQALELTGETATAP